MRGAPHERVGYALGLRQLLRLGPRRVRSMLTHLQLTSAQVTGPTHRSELSGNSHGTRGS